MRGKSLSLYTRPITRVKTVASTRDVHRHVKQLSAHCAKPLVPFEEPHHKIMKKVVYCLMREATAEAQKPRQQFKNLRGKAKKPRLFLGKMLNYESNKVSAEQIENIEQRKMSYLAYLAENDSELFSKATRVYKEELVEDKQREGFIQFEPGNRDVIEQLTLIRTVAGYRKTLQKVRSNEAIFSRPVDLKLKLQELVLPELRHRAEINSLVELYRNPSGRPINFEEVYNNVKWCGFLAQFKRRVVVEVLRQAQLVSLEKGVFLYRMGDRAEYFYLVVEGVVKIKAEINFEGGPQLVTFYSVYPGDIFGESGLQVYEVEETLEQRNHYAEAASQVRLLRVPRGLYSHLLDNYCDSEITFVAESLGRLANFSKFSERDLIAAAKCFQLKVMEPGSFLIREGEQQSGLALLVEGGLTILKQLVISTPIWLLTKTDPRVDKDQLGEALGRYLQSEQSKLPFKRFKCLGVRNQSVLQADYRVLGSIGKFVPIMGKTLLGEEPYRPKLSILCSSRCKLLTLSKEGFKRIPLHLQDGFRRLLSCQREFDDFFTREHLQAFEQWQSLRKKELARALRP